MKTVANGARLLFSPGELEANESITLSGFLGDSSRCLVKRGVLATYLSGCARVSGTYSNVVCQRYHMYMRLSYMCAMCMYPDEAPLNTTLILGSLCRFRWEHELLVLTKSSDLLQRFLDRVTFRALFCLCVVSSGPPASHPKSYATWPGFFVRCSLKPELIDKGKQHIEIMIIVLW